jgi:hypothetical protein
MFLCIAVIMNIFLLDWIHTIFIFSTILTVIFIIATIISNLKNH